MISYNLLAEEKYGLAKTILDFATDGLRTHSSEESRLRLVVNRARSLQVGRQCGSRSSNLGCRGLLGTQG